MRILLDTHFLIWILTGSRRLKGYSWLDRYSPWGVSPVSFLEMQCLAELRRIEVRQPDLTEAVLEDPRFLVDEVPLLSLIRHAVPLAWTRDPYDRLLVAHSAARRTPFCTVDRVILGHHSLLPVELGR